MLVPPAPIGGSCSRAATMPGMLHSLLATVRRSPRMSLLGLAVFVAITGKIAWQFLVLREPWQMLVDLDVYREAGLSVISGRPVYDYLTPTPQLLPYTYPPISAIASIPLTWLPLQPVGWVWTAIQMVLMAGIVTVAFRPLLDRYGPWRPVALGALTGLLFWLVPNKDGIMFGQVDIILVALCLADYATRRPGWPRGMLVGIATAVKLTPGVFIVHLWLAGKRREALTAVGAAAWLSIAALVAVIGFRYAVQCSRAGNDLAACAIVGLLAVLLSPVAWIHHLAWVVLSLAVIVGDGRDRRRVL